MVFMQLFLCDYFYATVLRDCFMRLFDYLCRRTKMKLAIYKAADPQDTAAAQAQV